MPQNSAWSFQIYAVFVTKTSTRTLQLPIFSHASEDYAREILSLSAAVSGADDKFISPEEFDKLPNGIQVVHEPKAAFASLTGKSERRAKYTWWYKTTVSAIDGDVAIVEFGAFAWRDGNRVVGGSFTGKPYGALDFADWYKCSKAILKKGESYSDPTNWSSAPELKAHKARWYFVGIDAQGKRVKGEAVVEMKAEFDPPKPKDVK